MIRKLILLLTLLPLYTKAQEQLFSEFQLTKSFQLDKESTWSLTSTTTYKHLYDDISWNRLGAIIQISHRNKWWKTDGGINMNYTFDKKIDNYLEIRPWLGIRYDVLLTERITLLNNARIEYRKYFYDDIDNTTDYWRTRYRIAIEFSFPLEKQNYKLRSSYEWYTVQNAAPDRYANTNELGLRLSKKTNRNKSIAFSYFLEVTRNTIIFTKQKNHVLQLDFEF